MLHSLPLEILQIPVQMSLPKGLCGILLEEREKEKDKKRESKVSLLILGQMRTNPWLDEAKIGKNIKRK